MEHAVVNSRIVISRRVMSLDRVAKGELGPSSSANCFTFHGLIFVMADSVECIRAVRTDRKNHSKSP